MKKFIVFAISIGMIGILLTGCSTTKTKKISVASTTTNKTKSIYIKTVITKSDPIKTDVPSIVVQKGIQYKLSNGNVVNSSVNNIKWSIILGKHSIVAAIIPKTSPRWYTVAGLLSNKNRWEIKDVTNSFSVPPKNSNRKNLHGIKLPSGNYSTGNPIPFGDKGKIWCFSNQGRVIVIAKYPQSPFSPPNGLKHIKIKNNDAWIIKKMQNVSFAYTIDEGNVVLVGGDITELEAGAILKSLPLSTTYTFPYNK